MWTRVFRMSRGRYLPSPSSWEVRIVVGGRDTGVRQGREDVPGPWRVPKTKMSLVQSGQCRSRQLVGVVLRSDLSSRR